MSTHLRSIFGFAVMVTVLAVISAAGAAPATIQLFNGKDFTNFYTYIGPPAKGEKPIGKNNDPKKVFQVEDGVIHVSGEIYGYLATEKEYENYHLTVEFKWGEKTYEPRKGKARDSGVLLHATGQDKVWPQCIECQMIEGGTCDIILVGGGDGKPTKINAPVDPRGKQFWYRPGAPFRQFANERINWFGRDPEWKDLAGFRGTQDVERPLGQWNVIECICDGSSITYKLNGVQMNSGTDANLIKGKILLQSEGAEVFFRKVELQPLMK
jgi:hypothetical protein